MAFLKEVHPSVRQRQGVLTILRKWHPKNGGEYLSRLYDEDISIWDYIVDKGKEEQRDIQNIPMTDCDVRISIEYIRNVIDENEVKIKEIRETAKARIIDFVKWERSEIGKFCFRLEEFTEKRRIQRQYSMVRKNLESKIAEGDLKAMELWSKFTGKYQGEIEDKETTPIVIVDEYKDGMQKEKIVAVPLSDSEKFKREKRGKQALKERSATIEEVSQKLGVPSANSEVGA